MDGNRRWARARGSSEASGHAAGVSAIRPIVERAGDRGVEVLSIYAFSRENWSRASHEVETLFALLEQAIREYTPDLVRDGVRVRVLGRLDELPTATRESIADALSATHGGRRMTLNVAFNYSGRSEIVDRVRRCLADGLAPGEVQRGDDLARLYTGVSRSPIWSSDGRRPAHQQLPHLAGRVRGAVLLRHAVAGLHAGHVRRRPRRVRPPIPALRSLIARRAATEGSRARPSHPGRPRDLRRGPALADAAHRARDGARRLGGRGAAAASGVPRRARAGAGHRPGVRGGRVVVRNGHAAARGHRRGGRDRAGVRRARASGAT
jgi:undecaprenyl diphosphate synthase